MREFELLRATVQSILAQAKHYDWTVQGIGMLRTYLDAEKRYRLNVWHSSLIVPDVSTVHDHPWGFTSWIISGRFVNERYVIPTSENYNLSPVSLFEAQLIKTGERGGPVGRKQVVSLCRQPPEIYNPGDSYSQKASEIHRSSYEDYTVTLNDRERNVGEHATVYWPVGTEWVDAATRPAIDIEVYQVTHGAYMAMRGFKNPDFIMSYYPTLPRRAK